MASQFTGERVYAEEPGRFVGIRDVPGGEEVTVEQPPPGAILLTEEDISALQQRSHTYQQQQQYQQQSSSSSSSAQYQFQQQQQQQVQQSVVVGTDAAPAGIRSYKDEQQQPETVATSQQPALPRLQVATPRVGGASGSPRPARSVAAASAASRRRGGRRRSRSPRSSPRANVTTYMADFSSGERSVRTSTQTGFSSSHARRTWFNGDMGGHVSDCMVLDVPDVHAWRLKKLSEAQRKQLRAHNRKASSPRAMIEAEEATAKIRKVRATRQAATTKRLLKPTAATRARSAAVEWQYWSPRAPGGGRKKGLSPRPPLTGRRLEAAIQSEASRRRNDPGFVPQPPRGLAGYGRVLSTSERVERLRQRKFEQALVAQGIDIGVSAFGAGAGGGVGGRRRKVQVVSPPKGVSMPLEIAEVAPGPSPPPGPTAQAQGGPTGPIAMGGGGATYGGVGGSQLKGESEVRFAQNVTTRADQVKDMYEQQML